MTDKKQTKNLIDTLAQEAAPVKPAMSPLLKTGLFVAASFAYVAFIVWAFYTTRQDLVGKLSTLAFGLEQLIALLMGIIAAAASLWISTPGSKGEKPLKYVAAVLLAILLGFVLFGTDMHSTFHNLDINMLLCGLHCSMDIMVFALPPMFLLLYLIKNLAPTNPALAGFFAVLSVAAFGYFAVRSTCAEDNIHHQMLSHILPLFIYITAGYFIGRKLLRW